MPELGESLSAREMDVLACIVQGATNKEIADSLSISENTVKVHLRRIYAKLGVSTRTEATTAAIQQGLVSVPGVEVVTEEEPAAADDSHTAVSAAEAVVHTAVPAPAARGTAAGARGPDWRSISLVLLVILAVIVVGLIGWQLFGGQATAETPETPTPPFAETPIEGTRWIVSRPLETGRAGMAVVSVGLDVYGIGGETAAGVVDTVSVYDTTHYTWRAVAAKPTAVADTTADVLFGEIYVPGGRLADGQPTSVVEVYSPANDAWRLVSALPEPIMGGLVLAQGGFLYVVGGWNGERYLDTAYEYNPRQDSWRPLPEMRHARAFATGAGLVGQLYAVGGSDGVQDLGVCEAFDPVAETWHSCPDMLQPRAGASATVLLNQLYVIGGGMMAGSEVTFSEEYNPFNQTWSVVNTPMLEETANWPQLGVTHVETRIYALGGRLAGQPSADTYVLQTVFQTFIPAIPKP